MSPDHACFRYLAGTEKVPMDRLVCFTLFQTLLGEDGNDTAFCLGASLNFKDTFPRR